MSLLLEEPPRLVRRIGALTAASAAIAPSLLVALGGSAGATPAAAMTPAASSQATAPMADEGNEPGCTTDDGTLVRREAITTSDGTQIGEVRLYYSPSSRCVWGAAESNSNVDVCCATEGKTEVWVHRNSDGKEVHGGTLDGQRKATTSAIHDANTTSYARGEIEDSGPMPGTGKTAAY
jgi:hypothetical protein